MNVLRVPKRPTNLSNPKKNVKQGHSGVDGADPAALRPHSHDGVVKVRLPPQVPVVRGLARNIAGTVSGRRYELCGSST
jgi:hypothetical protein